MEDANFDMLKHIGMADINAPHFDLQTACPVKDYVFEDYEHDSFGRFSSGLLDMAQMIIGKDDIEGFTDFVYNPTGSAFSVTKLDLQAVVFIGAIVTLLVISVVLILRSMVSAARKGWMNSVTKKFWFLGHWTCIVIQMAVYLFCLVGIIVGCVALSISFYSMRNDLKTAPELSRKIEQNIKASIDINRQQADCVYDLAVRDVFAPLESTAENITNWYYTEMKRRKDGFFSNETRNDMMRSVIYEDDIVLRHIHNLATLKTVDELQEEKYQLEISEAQQLVLAVHTQLTYFTQEWWENFFITTQALAAHNAKLLEAASKDREPLYDLFKRIDQAKKNVRGVIDEIVRSKKRAYSEWELGMVATARWFQSKSDPWTTYNGMYGMLALLVPFMISSMYILRGLYYSFKMLRGSSTGPVINNSKEETVVNGMFSIFFWIVFSTIAIYAILVLASPLSRTCSNVHTTRSWEFFHSAKLNGDGANYQDGQPWYYFEQSPLQSSEVVNIIIDLPKFIADLHDIKQQSVELPKSIDVQLVPLKASLTEWIRRNNLNENVTWSGLMVQSRESSGLARWIASGVRKLSNPLYSDRTASLILTRIDGIMNGTYGSPLMIETEYSSVGWISLLYKVKEQFYETMENYRKEIMFNFVHMKDRDRASAGYLMCHHVRDHFNAMWMVALLTMPFLFIAAINMIFTAKALSIASNYDKKYQVNDDQHIKQAYQQIPAQDITVEKS